MTTSLQNVDHSALRTNQAFIIGLNLIGFILDQLWLVGLVTLVMLIGTMVRRPGFGFVYKRVLKPIGIVQPFEIADNPEPHLFAQGFGGVVMLGGTFSLVLGAAGLGWGLVWGVIALAALNLFGGFCVGCAVYYWLNRLKVPGFVKSPPTGTFPGMRPKGESG